MLQCSSTVFICSILVYASSQQNGDVRLEGHNSANRGRVEVYIEEFGDWTTVCFDYRDVESQEGVAQAVCRQLGFYNFKDIGNVTKFGLPANETDMLEKLLVIDCPANSDPQNAAQHILRCIPVDGSCEDGDDMAVQCGDESRGSSPFDTMVDFLSDDPSLQGSSSEGFAGVYVNEKWGPVCNMKKADADTFCKQLSYTNAVNVEELTNTTMLEREVLDQFHCTNTTNSACLRRCFDYPSTSQEISCPDGFSYVTCTFATGTPNDDLLENYGTRSICTDGSSNAGTIAGAVVGSLLAVAAIAIVTVALCVLVPGCYCYRGKRAPGTSKKYDAL